MPKVSVIMPTYNAQEYLRESLESVLNQTFEDFELLIIDDGSTDKTIEIINSYQDKRIKIIQGDKKGISSALNKGIENASGKYIARMDADDICAPNRFENQVKYLDNTPEIGMSVTWVDIISDYKFSFWGKDAKTPKDFNTALLFQNPIVHPSVMFRTQLFKDKGLKYNENYKCAEDYELWSRLINTINIGVIQKNLLHYRFYENNATNNMKVQGKINYLSVIQRNLLQYCNIAVNGMLLETFYPNIIFEKINENDILDIILLYLNIIEVLKSNNNFDTKIIKEFLSKRIMEIVNNHLHMIDYKKLKDLLKCNNIAEKICTCADVGEILRYILRYILRHPFFLFNLKHQKNLHFMIFNYLRFK